MNRFRMILAGLLLILGQAAAQDMKFDKPPIFKKRLNMDNIEVYVDHGTLILRCKYCDDESIEITRGNRLFINGEQIKTNEYQRELTQAYYDSVQHAIEVAKRIGLEGAKIGLQGAKIGLTAAAGVFRLVLPGYGTEDFERDMELASGRLEERAEALEIKAEALEWRIDELEDMHGGLKRHIRELRRLDWF